MTSDLLVFLLLFQVPQAIDLCQCLGVAFEMMFDKHKINDAK